MIDLNLLDVIVRGAELTRADLVLEVGTGTGGLTTRLAEQAGAVLSIEIDRDFHELAKDSVADVEHIRLLHADALKNKNRLNPELFTQLEELRQIYKPRHIKLVSNLPYAVATPVISNLLMSDVQFERMVVTVQWEIAEKLTAAPGGNEFGALSVLVQTIADVEILRHVSPAAFWPRPAVESGIVRIWPRPAKRLLAPPQESARRHPEHPRRPARQGVGRRQARRSWLQGHRACRDAVDRPASAALRGIRPGRRQP